MNAKRLTDLEVQEAIEMWHVMTKPYMDMLVKIYSMAKPIGLVCEGRYEHVRYELTPTQQELVNTINKRLEEIKKEFQCLGFLPLEQ